VDEDALAQLAQTVEDAIRATGVAEVPSDEVGLVILEPLRDLDEVAYLRFASVYKAFTSADDFEKAITELRTSGQAGSATGAPIPSTPIPSTPIPSTPISSTTTSGTTTPREGNDR